MFSFIGTLPWYIKGGTYMRVGPSKFDFKDFTVNHWLDGKIYYIMM